MKQICFLVLAVLMLAGCSAVPEEDAAIPTAPPSTLQIPSEEYSDQLFSRLYDGAALSDSELCELFASIIRPEDDEPSVLSVGEITVCGHALIVRMSSADGMAEHIRDTEKYAEFRKTLLSTIPEVGTASYALLQESDRDDLDFVVQIMSDEDPSIPLFSSINGMTFYDAGVDDPSDAAFDPARYSVRALAAAVALKAADRSDDDFHVSDLRVQSNTIVLDISTPNGLRAYVQAQNPENAPVWKTYRSAFAGFTRAAHEYCASRGREDVSVVVRVLNDVEPVDPLIVACDGEITTDNTLWRTLEGWNSMKGETAP